MAAPPPLPPRPAGWQPTPLEPHQYLHASAPAGFPPAPLQPAPPPSRWNEHLFYTNGRPTPAFEALMREFFTRLDVQRTGYIAPETFSGFLDACHYRLEHDVWKRNLKGNVMYRAEDMADFELKAALEGFYFDHKVVVRDPNARQLPYGGMPMLSLAGFTDFMGVEFAADPDLILSGLNNALKQYRIYPEKGPLPRYVLPAKCPPELQHRIEQATVRCSNGARQKLDANQARLQLEAQGQQNALDLLSDRRYYYY